MAAKRIPRRTILRGMSGAALALPVLDIMRGSRAHALGIAPQRLVLCYAGVSIGNASQAPWDMVVPKKLGKDYEITLGLKSITPDIKADMGLVSGLKIPTGGSNGSSSGVPPGGRIPNFHQSTKAPQIGGTATFQNDNYNQESPRGPSADQLIADIIAGPTTFKTLPLCITPQVSSVENHTVSFQKPTGRLDKWGRPLGMPIDPVISPRVLYQKLFGETPVDGGDQLALAKKMLETRTSVIDAVGEKTKQLLSRLGQEDRRQLDRYFSHVVKLENQIRNIDPAALAKCKRPPAVTEDPAPARGFSKDPNSEIPVSQTSDWSNETLRGHIQVDSIATAFACDLTRVVGWHFGESQCGINMYPINGALTNMHGTGHFNPGGTIQNSAACIDWHVGHLARLVKALADTPDIDGRRVLDNTVILMCFEGGYGRDPSGAASNEAEYAHGVRTSHSSENMIVIMAGGGGGLKTGQHIQYNANPATLEWTSRDRHPAQVMLTAITALGYRGDALGEVKGTLPEMLRLA